MTRRYGYIPLHSVASNTAPALSPESTLFVEYCTGGPSSTTPALLELCVDPFDTAPPPQDLFAGLASLLYTAPPFSTGDSSFDSCLSSPWVVTVCMLLELGPHCGGAWTSLHMGLVLRVHGLHGDCTPTMPTTGTS
ncbi:uncharacterized protein UHOD_11040 [Ustilago sp. UG-2017b]|nr:uncharacterized protein UHOD_11040 [Ustilago sp. UG-2017b]